MNKLYTKNDFSRLVDVEEKESKSRSSFRRDYARLLHSPAFRRLQGKTQLYPSNESDFFRNRLTHSLEVSQIAKSIALVLNESKDFLKENPIDTDLVEFAALAHDLGHPPFGHNGEKALDDCMKKWGGFEGNAQTLRLLSVVEKKQTKDNSFVSVTDEGIDNRLGLNLTYRSLAAILKYDKKIPNSRKTDEPLVKGYYLSEEPLVEKIKSNVAPGLDKSLDFKTIECQIMDLADDIAYSTYDLEDGLKSGFVNPLSLMTSVSKNIQLLNKVTEKASKVCGEISGEDVLSTLGIIFGLDKDGNSIGMGVEEVITPLDVYHSSGLYTNNGYVRTQLTSALVDRFISGVSLKINEDYPALSEIVLDGGIRRQIEVLKHLNFEVTIMSPRLKLVEFRGYEIVSGIFKALEENGGHLLLPPDIKECYQKLKSSTEKTRVICDFVAGMTDRYAIEFFGRLKQGDQSIFKPF